VVPLGHILDAVGTTAAVAQTVCPFEGKDSPSVAPRPCHRPAQAARGDDGKQGRSSCS
jgi:hypothetical protein